MTSHTADTRSPTADTPGIRGHCRRVPRLCARPLVVRVSSVDRGGGVGPFAGLANGATLGWFPGRLALTSPIARLHRHAVLRRRNPPQLITLIDALALERVIGRCRRPAPSTRVPGGTGCPPAHRHPRRPERGPAHAGVNGGFTVIRRPTAALSCSSKTAPPACFSKNHKRSRALPVRHPGTARALTRCGRITGVHCRPGKATRRGRARAG